MCFGYDGEGALRRSLKEGCQPPLAVPRSGGRCGRRRRPRERTRRSGVRPQWSRGRARQRSVPHDRISIQLYTLRDAMGGQPGFDTGAHPARSIRLREGRVRRLLRPHCPADPRPARRPRHPGILEPRRASAPMRRPCTPSSRTRRRSASGTSSCPTSTRTRCRTGRPVGRPDERRGRGREASTGCATATTTMRTSSRSTSVAA